MTARELVPTGISMDSEGSQDAEVIVLHPDDLKDVPTQHDPLDKQLEFGQRVLAHMAHFN